MSSSCVAPLNPAFFSHNHFLLLAVGLQNFVIIVSVVCIAFVMFIIIIIPTSVSVSCLFRVHSSTHLVLMLEAVFSSEVPAAHLSSQTERWQGSFTHLPATGTHAITTVSKRWYDKTCVCAVHLR
jgi:hypothetical protein